MHVGLHASTSNYSNPLPLYTAGLNQSIQSEVGGDKPMMRGGGQEFTLKQPRLIAGAPGQFLWFQASN
jgi:hypothetical protein